MTATPRILEQHIPAGETPTVYIPHAVRGDLIFGDTVALPGVHTAFMNRYGAVSVMAGNGRLLGLRPGEFEWVSGKPSHWCEGDKLTWYVITPYEGDWTHEAAERLVQRLSQSTEETPA